ncbi:MAG: hypothetical protein IID50_13115, partial [Proteobacteria bacterium]|nr:hypothetical protein [Pseudomonadota bacterium]
MVVLMLGLVSLVPGVSPAYAEVIVNGNGDSGAATSSGAKAHRGKDVTIPRSAKSNSGYRVRHPRAVVIFASNNRGGLFAKGVKVKNAFKKKHGRNLASRGTATPSTNGYGPAIVAHGGKGGGLSNSGSVGGLGGSKGGGL